MATLAAVQEEEEAGGCGGTDRCRVSRRVWTGTRAAAAAAAGMGGGVEVVAAGGTELLRLAKSSSLFPAD
jgi:hypothetical protein